MLRGVVLPGNDNRTCFVLEDDRLETASRTPPNEPRTHDFLNDKTKDAFDEHSPRNIPPAMPEHCGGDRGRPARRFPCRFRQFAASNERQRRQHPAIFVNQVSKQVPDFDPDQMDQLAGCSGRRHGCRMPAALPSPARLSACSSIGGIRHDAGTMGGTCAAPNFRFVWGVQRQPLERNVGCLPGVFRFPAEPRQQHLCRRGGAGKGTTVDAVQMTVGVVAYFRRSAERLKTAWRFTF